MDIKALFRERDVEFREYGDHHHVTIGWTNVDCPRCSPNSGKFRLGWNLKGNYFSCWSCGRLPTVGILMELTHLPAKAIKSLIEDLHVDRYQVELRPLGNLQLPDGLGLLRRTHIEYLRSRGFQNTDELVDTWKIQGISHRNPKLAWRIFIPIYADGEMISWTTRATSELNPLRYSTAKAEQEKINLKQVLYGGDLVNHTVIVVEGPLDAWKIGPGAVAIMGLQYTRSQLLQIARYPNRFVCLDSEPEAQKVALKLCNDLVVFGGTTTNIVLDGNDPGSANDEELCQLKGLLK